MIFIKNRPEVFVIALLQMCTTVDYDQTQYETLRLELALRPSPPQTGDSSRMPDEFYASFVCPTKSADQLIYWSANLHVWHLFIVYKW